MSETKNKIEVVRFETFYKALQPNITSTKNGILYFNSDNELLDNAMPQKLIDLKHKSPIHSNFIDLKSSLIATPGGLFAVDDNNIALNTFINTRNRAGDTVNKVWSKCSNDLSLFEQCFIEVIYNRDSTVSEIYHKPVNTLRAGECNDLGFVDKYYYSNTWGLITNKRDRRKSNDVSNAIPINAFDIQNISGSTGRQTLHIKKYNSCSDEYPIPGYMSAEHWINLAYEIGAYVLNKFQNGFMIQGFLYINSEASEDEQHAFIRDFKANYQGTKAKNQIVFVFGSTAVSKPEFVPIQDSLSSSVFKDYMLEATKQIVYAHGGSLELLGLSNSDTFGAQGDASNINVSRLQYINDVIIPYQQNLLEGFNKIFEVNQLGQATVLNDSLKLVQPELQPTDTTEDERREMVLGLTPKVTNNPTTQIPVI